MSKEYIVIECSAWMNDSGYGINYGTDSERFSSYRNAERHGWQLVGSDDFQIGMAEGNKLIDTMKSETESIGEDTEALNEIAEQLGLTT